MWESKRALRRELAKAQQQLAADSAERYRAYREMTNGIFGQVIAMGRLIAKLQRRVQKWRKAAATLHNEKRRLEGQLKESERHRENVAEAYELAFAEQDDLICQLRAELHDTQDRLASAEMAAGVANPPSWLIEAKEPAVDE